MINCQSGNKVSPPPLPQTHANMVLSPTLRRVKGEALGKSKLQGLGTVTVESFLSMTDPGFDLQHQQREQKN